MKKKSKQHSTREIKYLSQTQLERFFDAIKRYANVRDIALFHIAYYCGLRASEVGLMSLDDWEPRYHILHVRRLKDSLSCSIVLDQPRSFHLRQYIAHNKFTHPYQPLFPSRHGEGISRSTLDKLMKKYGELAKLPADRRHMHTLRHSIAVHMLDSGADIADVRRHLGHRALSTTYIYAKYTKIRQKYLHNLLRNSKHIAR